MACQVKCSFLLGTHWHPLLEKRARVCRLHTYPCFIRVKMWFKQGSDGGPKELYGRPWHKAETSVKQNTLPACYPQCRHLLSGKLTGEKSEKDYFLKTSRWCSERYEYLKSFPWQGLPLMELKAVSQWKPGILNPPFFCSKGNINAESMWSITLKSFLGMHKICLYPLSVLLHQMHLKCFSLCRDRVPQANSAGRPDTVTISDIV